MTSVDKVRRSKGPLHAIALIARVVGAIGSIAFMLFVGRHNSSRLLLLAFATWVLSPFAMLTWASVVSQWWSTRTRTALYLVTILVALGSLAIYGAVALGPPRPKPAALFLLVPPASWLVIAFAIAAAAFLSGRPSRSGETR